MKKNGFLSIFIMMLMGILPFNNNAQQVVVIYPYMNYLNIPCDDPSQYISHNRVLDGHGTPNIGFDFFNDGCINDTAFLTEVFNYPVAGKPDTRLIYGVAFILRAGDDRNLLELLEADTIDIELYKVTEGEADIHLIKKKTDYLYPGKKPDKILLYQPVGHRGDSTIYYTDPLYEFYFDEPVSVTGTFLVCGSLRANGLTYFLQTNWRDRAFQELFYYDAIISKRDQKIVKIQYLNLEDGYVFYCDTAGLPAPDIELEGIKNYRVQSAFPILVPEGTTAVPTVEGGEPFEVLLTPNPATEQATAATEAGIRSIEVVDMAGRIVVRHSYPALPHNVTFDVKALPRGIYAVRVDTPQGIATKKLAVE